MIKSIPLQNILFLDIETVPLYPHFSDLSEVEQELYAEKTQYQRKDEISAEDFYHRAGIWAEFGKIICISVGFFVEKSGERQFRLTSYHGEERGILKKFSNLIEQYYSTSQYFLCGHNIKEFDIPFIVRRMLILGLSIPHKLDFMGKKPWEITHLDTLELWKFGDYKHYTSLKLLTHVLQIPTPKDDIDGSEVQRVFYEEQDIDRIIIYCEKDVVAVAQIILKLRQEALLDKTEIKSV